MTGATPGPLRDTIFARASGSGRGAIAVVRVSGAGAREVCQRLTGRPPPPARLASVRALRTADGAPLDRALLLWFARPASFTGEDLLELHLHGGRGVVAAVSEELSAMPRVRPAEPGEFTRRAFLNGRIDLTAAEGIADLVEAETRAQVRQAARVMEGELARLYDGWREALVRAQARLEAEIDFAPEDEVPGGASEEVRPVLARLAEEIRAHLADGRRGERLREGYSVAIVGPPNAGKSSLLNRLARRDVAIVTPEAGTTRDVLEVPLDLAGYPVTVLDTAGLRAAESLAEAAGVSRARERARHADLEVVVMDGARWPEIDPLTRELISPARWLVANKSDLGRVPADAVVDGLPVLCTSCLTEEGLATLVERLAAAAADALEGRPGAAPTRARHRAGLEDTLAALVPILDGDGLELALAAEQVRLASRALGRLTGQVDVEEVLDRIFSAFCIGK